jgi:hypothetical protein
MLELASPDLDMHLQMLLERLGLSLADLYDRDVPVSNNVWTRLPRLASYNLATCSRWAMDFKKKPLHAICRSQLYWRRLASKATAASVRYATAPLSEPFRAVATPPEPTHSTAGSDRCPASSRADASRGACAYLSKCKWNVSGPWDRLMPRNEPEQDCGNGVLTEAEAKVDVVMLCRAVLECEIEEAPEYEAWDASFGPSRPVQDAGEEEQGTAGGVDTTERTTAV